MKTDVKYSPPIEAGASFNPPNLAEDFMLLLSVLNPVVAQDSDMTANERQAKRIFNQAYQQVFGEQGAKLHYDVNIVGIYKTNGTIWFKGKKKKFV
ncbi:MAG: hypothetical protein IIT39_12705, partial [Clostridia bacterium]|nr:hypothetical protein [Clostridia bacterium]